MSRLSTDLSRFCAAHVAACFTELNAAPNLPTFLSSSSQALLQFSSVFLQTKTESRPRGFSRAFQAPVANVIAIAEATPIAAVSPAALPVSRYAHREAIECDAPNR